MKIKKKQHKKCPKKKHVKDIKIFLKRKEGNYYRKLLSST